MGLWILDSSGRMEGGWRLRAAASCDGSCWGAERSEEPVDVVLDDGTGEYTLYIVANKGTAGRGTYCDCSCFRGMSLCARTESV